MSCKLEEVYSQRETGVPSLTVPHPFRHPPPPFINLLPAPPLAVCPVPDHRTPSIYLSISELVWSPLLHLIPSGSPSLWEGAEWVGRVGAGRDGVEGAPDGGVGIAGVTVETGSPPLSKPPTSPRLPPELVRGGCGRRRESADPD